MTYYYKYSNVFIIFLIFNKTILRGWYSTGDWTIPSCSGSHWTTAWASTTSAETPAKCWQEKSVHKRTWTSRLQTKTTYWLINVCTVYGVCKLCIYIYIQYMKLHFVDAIWCFQDGFKRYLASQVGLSRSLKVDRSNWFIQLYFYSSYGITLFL